jgi:hypothetical protein
MKKFFVSAGLAAMGAAALDSAMADEGVGDATGPKYWSVGATLRGFYDDNYAITTTQKGSGGIEFSPNVSVHVPLQQTDFGLRYTYGLYYYQDRQDAGVNPYDQSHQLDLWLDHAFNERWKTEVTDSFRVGQEPELLNPNPTVAVATPYRVDGDNISNHGQITVDTKWTRLLSTTISYGNSYVDFSNSGAYIDSSGMLVAPEGGIGGASLAGLLNSIQQSVSLDLNWHLRPDTTAFVGYQFSWADYTAGEPIAIDPVTGFIYHSSDRNSDSQYGYLGLEEDFTSNLSLIARVGATYTDVYGDPILPYKSWSPYADISLSYTYIPGSYVQFGFTHDISSTDQVAPNSAGQITQYSEDSVIYVDVNHRITRKLVATIIGRVQLTSYQGGAANSASTTDYGLGLNLTYQLNTHLSFDAGYNYDNVVSDISGYGYSRNRVYLGMTANY